MNVSCKCNRHRIPKGSNVSVHEEGVETERHTADRCTSRVVDGTPRTMVAVQPRAQLRNVVKRA